MGINIKDWFKGIRGSGFNLSDDDIVVFVVGPSGSGKTSFLAAVTKSGFFKGSTSLRPSTVTPQAVRCELTEGVNTMLGVKTQKNIVFVDTPSFHTGGGEEAEKEVRSWMNKLRFKSTLIGTIYMHRIETDPAREPIQPHLSTFASTLPQSIISHALPERLRAVFSYESNMDTEKLARHKAEFWRQLGELTPSITHGKLLKWQTDLHPEYFRRDDSETAWKAVVELLSQTRA